MAAERRRREAGNRAGKCFEEHASRVRAADLIKGSVRNGAVCLIKG